MKRRITSWGKNAENKKYFFAFELLARENQVDVHMIAGDQLKQEQENLLNNQWREGGEIPFPENFETTRKELTITESLLPEGFQLDNPGLLKRSQTEWNFMVMSQKLADLYQQEAEDFKEKIENLTQFDNGIWESLKTYWNKVNSQIREKNLLRKHANDLHDTTNDLFNKMKDLRKKMDDEFKEISEKNKEKFSELIDGIEEKIKSGISFQPIFNELKKIQKELKNSQLTRGHRKKLWDRIDAAFKTVKENRFGEDGSSEGTRKSRLQQRYDGLIEVIQRMQRSIKRDENDLNFQNKRINTTSGQLEAEIRKAKTQMIEERIRSKKAKLEDMMKTKSDLEARLEKEKQREAEAAQKKKEEEEKRRAEAEIKDKIASEINDTKESRKEDLDKLLHAAEAINSSRNKGKSKTSESESEKQAEGDGELRVGEFISDQLEDVVDTARAIASVLGSRIEKAFDKISEEE